MRTVLINIKKKSNELLSGSTSHAISIVFRAEGSYLKILCFIASLLSAAFFAILVTKDISDYLKFPVTTNVRFKYETKVPFPVVGVCNTNPYTTKASIILIKEHIQKQYNHKKTENISDLDFVNEYLNNKVYKRKIIEFLEYSYLNWNYTLKSTLGISIEDMIISCEFNGVECNLQTDFEVNFSYYNGKCFLYNLIGDKYSTAMYPSDGLILELFSGFEELHPVYKKGKLKKVYF